MTKKKKKKPRVEHAQHVYYVERVRNTHTSRYDRPKYVSQYNHCDIGTLNFSRYYPSTMDHCKSFIKAEFPSIDIEMFQYIEGKAYARLVLAVNRYSSFHCRSVKSCCFLFFLRRWYTYVLYSLVTLTFVFRRFRKRNRRLPRFRRYIWSNRWSLTRNS